MDWPWVILAVLLVDGVLFALYRAYRYFVPTRPPAGDYTALETRVALLESRLKSYHADLHEDLRWRIITIEKTQNRMNEEVQATRQAIDLVIEKMKPPR
jgi:hypothetical protein